MNRTSAREPPSSFDKLRIRATFQDGRYRAASTFEFLILSLSKDEEFAA
jgi:hypothetical protein